MTPEGEQLLRDGLGALSIVPGEHQVQQFGQLHSLLVERNAHVNLTALKTERDIVLKHFIDSACCLRGAHLDGDLTVIDVGTGAGFPALPLAVLRPALQLTPLDSIRKKIDFVRDAATQLALPQVQPVVGRAETLGRDPHHRGRYDRVVVRAVAALPVLVELALPLLRSGGRLVAQKGAIGEDELAAGRRAAAEVGGEIIAAEPFELPLLGDARSLIVVEKTRPTPRTYPRREGVPARQPLFWTAK